MVMVETRRGPLAWEPVRLSTDNVFFDTNCLSREVQRHGAWTLSHQDGVTRIEGEGSLVGLLTHCRFRLLQEECLRRQIAIEYLCESISDWIACVEKVEPTRGPGSHQFWSELRDASTELRQYRWALSHGP